MRYVVVASGSADELPDRDAVGTGYDAIVCADGGARNASRLGLTPSVVVGDLDSLDTAERERLHEAGCLFVVHPAAKDETDLELALLWCLEHGATDIVVVGAFGGRPDHLLANILLLADERFRRVDLRLVARGWTTYLLRREITLRGRRGDTVSLIPLSQRVTGITTDGLLYPLHGETLRRGPARGVSNVMTADVAHVRVERGLLFVFHGPAQHSPGHGEAEVSSNAPQSVG